MVLPLRATDAGAGLLSVGVLAAAAALLHRRDAHLVARGQVAHVALDERQHGGVAARRVRDVGHVRRQRVARPAVAAAAVVVVEGSLSFLGLSVQLPTSSWGNMINQARRDIKVNFGQILYPSMILTLTVLALNQVGDFFQRRSAFRGSSL